MPLWEFLPAGPNSGNLAQSSSALGTDTEKVVLLLSLINKCSTTTVFCVMENRITFILTANADVVDTFNRAHQAEYKQNQFLGATVFSRDGILLVRQNNILYTAGPLEIFVHSIVVFF